MRIYISADIEGVCGITHWDEASKASPDYSAFQAQMQREVVAACEGAIAAGAREIRIKDAHASARNLDPWGLPRQAHLVREWSQHPLMMVQELDASFDAVLFVGYHAGAGCGGNPLSHTLTGAYHSVRVNGAALSEFHLYSLAAAELGVPTAFVSGDAALCQQVTAHHPGILTVATGTGRGRSIIARHPAVVVEEIRRTVEQALRGLPAPAVVPDPIALEVEYRDHREAFRGQFYPGAELVGDRVVGLTARSWFDVLRALVFLK
jgi:D-amino peptidase